MIAPAVDRLKVLEDSCRVPVLLPMLVVAVPVVLMVVVPRTVVVLALLPMAVVPVDEPVLIEVLKFELLLREMAAPETVAPPVPVIRPEAFRVVTPETAPPVVMFRALEATAKVPVALPIAVLAVPVVLMVVVPTTVAPPLAVRSWVMVSAPAFVVVTPD